MKRGVVFWLWMLWCLPSSASALDVVVLGDSLSAGYGIEIEKGWVHLLDTELSGLGLKAAVVNASISGETTRGGLHRISGLLTKHAPDIVVVALGGNDGLRGMPVDETRSNLHSIVSQSLHADARVLLVGIELPPNYGTAYTDRFRAIFVDVSTQLEVPLVPFLLEGVALEPALMQPDGLHPTAQAQPRLLDNVMPHLLPLLSP